jgi:hypothetical protein
VESVTQLGRLRGRRRRRRRRRATATATGHDDDDDDGDGDGDGPRATGHNDAGTPLLKNLKILFRVAPADHLKCRTPST